MEFEKKLAEIEGILESLSSGDISLDESLNLFEKGMNLTKECFDYLENYKGKFEVLQKKFDSLNGE